MISSFSYCCCFFTVLGFYINWAHSEIVEEYNGQVEGALNAAIQPQENVAESRLKKDVHNDDQVPEYEAMAQPLGALASRELDLSELQEAKLRIRELETKLIELDKRIPKKFPNVNFLTLSRKRILVSVLCRKCY